MNTRCLIIISPRRWRRFIHPFKTIERDCIMIKTRSSKYYFGMIFFLKYYKAAGSIGLNGPHQYKLTALKKICVFEDNHWFLLNRYFFLWSQSRIGEFLSVGLKWGMWGWKISPTPKSMEKIMTGLKPIKIKTFISWNWSEDKKRIADHVIISLYTSNPC